LIFRFKFAPAEGPGSGKMPGRRYQNLRNPLRKIMWMIIPMV